MEQALLTVDGVDSKEINTKRGPGTIYIVKADGREYTTFDQDTAGKASVLRGQRAVFYFETDTNTKPNKQGVMTTYTNYRLKALEPAAVNGTGDEPAVKLPTGPSPTSVVTVPAQAPIQTQAKPQDDKEGNIARAVALKAAVELAAAGIFGDITAGGVIDLAKAFEPYLKGEVVPAAPDSVAAVATSDVDIPF